MTLSHLLFTVRPCAETGWTDGGSTESVLNQFVRRAKGPENKRSLPLFSV